MVTRRGIDDAEESSMLMIRECICMQSLIIIIQIELGFDSFLVNLK